MGILFDLRFVCDHVLVVINAGKWNLCLIGRRWNDKTFLERTVIYKDAFKVYGEILLTTSNLTFLSAPEMA